MGLHRWALAWPWGPALFINDTGCGGKNRLPTEAAARARAGGCCGQHLVGYTATTSRHVPVLTAAASYSVLELCRCLRFGGAAQRRRPSYARAGAAAATCSCCWCCWPGPCGQHRGGGAVLDMTPSWSFAAVPRRCTGCVARPQSSQSWNPAQPS